jgi:hypothetical protein
MQEIENKDPDRHRDMKQTSDDTLDSQSIADCSTKPNEPCHPDPLHGKKKNTKNPRKEESALSSSEKERGTG